MISPTDFSVSRWSFSGVWISIGRSLTRSAHCDHPADLINRASDFALILLVAYAIVALLPALSPHLALLAHFLHALSWRLFHSYGLGLLLRAQSKTKWLVRHYLKHYHYHGQDEDSSEELDLGISRGFAGREKEGVVKRATEEAFGNWQVGYNISLVMTYGTFSAVFFPCK